MKKFVAILLAFLFLQSHIGLALVKHYCGGMLASENIGLYAPEASCGMEKKTASSQASSCEKSGKAKENHCCHNETEHLQVDDDSLKAPSLASLEMVPFVLFLISFALGGFRLVEVSREVALSGFSPPHRFTHLRFRAFLQIFRN